MAVKSVSYFKEKFKSGYTITEQDYEDWLDSFRSVLDPVPLGDTTGLEGILAAYRKSSDGVPVGDIEGLTGFVNGLTAGFLTAATGIEMANVNGLIDALNGKVSVGELAGLIASAIVNYIPAVGPNGNWFVNGVDLEYAARGPQGLRGLQGLRGPQGVQGVQGDPGTGINLLGELANEGELPEVGNVGDAYLIGGDIWLWVGSDWQNGGSIQGPPGETGDNIELRVYNGEIQWKLSETISWTKLVDLEDLKGADGFTFFTKEEEGLIGFDGNVRLKNLLGHSKTENVSGDYNINFKNAFSHYILTLTGDTSIHIMGLDDLGASGTIIFTMRVTGAHELNFPGWLDVVGDGYDGGVDNMIVVNVERGGAVPVGVVTITNLTNV